jgi:hypothetical protein
MKKVMSQGQKKLKNNLGTKNGRKYLREEFTGSCEQVKIEMKITWVTGRARASF